MSLIHLHCKQSSVIREPNLFNLCPAHLMAVGCARQAIALTSEALFRQLRKLL